MTAILKEVCSPNPFPDPVTERLGNLTPLGRDRPSRKAFEDVTDLRRLRTDRARIPVPFFWHLATPDAAGWARQFNCEHAGISPREHLQADRIPALHLPKILHCTENGATPTPVET